MASDRTVFHVTPYVNSWKVKAEGAGPYEFEAVMDTKEEAEREQIEFLGGEAAVSEANHLKMRVGKSKRTWVANCVAVGLAGGFIEPLESTGLTLVVIALDELCERLRDGTYDGPGSKIIPRGRAANQQAT